MGSTIFNKAIKKGSSCQKLTEEDAYSLVEEITPNNLYELGHASFKNRFIRYGNFATYVFNIHINPTNICRVGCSFCSYAASDKSKHAYIMNESEIFKNIDNVCPTEVHIVGGLNEFWPYSRNLNLLKALRKRYPNLYIKAFTAVEIEYFAKTLGCNEDFILEELKTAGLNAMPGGGAEIFSNRLYLKHWKNKTSPSNWIRIHQLAHEKGIPSNATMLFGFGDTWVERIKHLLILRNTQAQSGGFSSFIPLPFQPGKGNFLSQGPTPLETLTVLAVSRLILDNIPHIKSYWPMMGISTSAVGLSWGADDIDGTITEEKVAHFAGATTPVGMTVERMMETIMISGFIPKERDGNFNSKIDRPVLKEC